MAISVYLLEQSFRFSDSETMVSATNFYIARFLFFGKTFLFRVLPLVSRILNWLPSWIPSEQRKSIFPPETVRKRREIKLPSSTIRFLSNFLPHRRVFKLVNFFNTIRATLLETFDVSRNLDSLDSKHCPIATILFLFFSHK